LHFIDEGVFDLVNSVCGQSVGGQNGGLRLNGRTVVRQLLPDADPCEALATMSPVPATPAVAMSPLLLSPESAVASRTRRLEEERRSAELSGENEQLRRELARSSEVGEALQQQHQVAEDRMFALEHERVWLTERLGRMEPGEVPDAVAAAQPGPCGCPAPSELEAESQHLVQDRSRRALRVELEDACQPPEDPELRKEHLEHRLRHSEELARTLAEENARLQAALGGASPTRACANGGGFDQSLLLEGTSTMVEVPRTPKRGVVEFEVPTLALSGIARTPSTPPEAISICTPKGSSPGLGSASLYFSWAQAGAASPGKDEVAAAASQGNGGVATGDAPQAPRQEPGARLETLGLDEAW